MNQNDFYRELMLKYSLDSEKIKAKAVKKAKRPFAERIFTEHKAVAACACAALVLTAGVYGFVSLGGSGSPLDIFSSNDVLSASQRLEEAEDNYVSLALASQDEAEPVAMYISFKEAISYSEALMTFSSVSDTGDVQPSAVYFVDGTHIGRSELVSFAAARNGEKIVSGMRITAPISYYTEIQELNIVYLVETESDKLNTDTFTPIGMPAAAELTSATQTTPSASVPVPDDEKMTIGNSESSIVIQTDIVQNSTSDEQSSSEVISEQPQSDTSSPDTEIDVTNDDVSVPTTESPTLENADYTISLNGVIGAAMIGEDSVIVLAEGGAYVYRIVENASAELIASAQLIKPKVEWSSVAEKHILISGCDINGSRCVLVDFSIENMAFSSYDLNGIMTDCELGGVYYSAAESCIFMKSVGTDKTNVYFIASANGAAYATPIVTSRLPVTPLSYNDGCFTYAVYEAERTVVYSIAKGETVAVETAVYSTEVVFTRSNFFNCYAVSDNVNDETITRIFDGRGASCTVITRGQVVFGMCDNGVVYFDDTGIYVIENNIAVPKTYEETIGMFEGNKKISDYSVTEIGSGYIVVSAD